MTFSRALLNNPGTVILGLSYACALVLVRVLQLIAIGLFTGGVEFASDIQFQRIYVTDPLQLLLGRSTTYDVFPPLFPLALWSIYTPISWALSPFYAMRLAMCAIELLAWPLLWWIIASKATGRTRHLLAISYIIAPISWVSAVIMCQEEVLSLGFFAAVTVALLRNRTRLAILLCGVGVVVAKIYFFVPLVGLLGVPANRSWKEWWRDVAIGWSPIVAVYGLQAVLIGQADVAAAAFERFFPSSEVSVNLWALIECLFSIGDERARRISAVLALSLSMLPLLVIWRQGKKATQFDQIRVITAMLLWVYLSFYHINPEYFLIIVPGILVLFRPPVAALIMIAGFSLPWAVNFFYGVGVGMRLGDEGRATFVRAYQAVFSIAPSVMQGIAIALTAVVTVGLAAVLTWRPAEESERRLNRTLSNST
jgi:hypothetical protein